MLLTWSGPKFCCVGMGEDINCRVYLIIATLDKVYFGRLISLNECCFSFYKINHYTPPK